MLLKLKKVTKKYPEKNKKKYTALKRISVSFQPGEFVAIVGESGSGKSTLMNLIGSLDTNFSGDILYNKNKIQQFSEKELANYRQSTIGFIFQDFHLISHLTVLQNITLAMTLSHSASDKVAEATKLLKDLGMEKYISKKPSQLSGGQCQRVAIARALVNNPNIILADEPTGALDEKNAKQVIKILKKIANSGKLVIVVTHSEKVAKEASRVISLCNGKILHDKANYPTKKIKKRPKPIATKRTMSFMTCFKLALSNMKQKKGRNALITFGFSIGIFSIITMIALGNGMTGYVQTTMNQFVNPDVIETYKPTENSGNDNEVQSSNNTISQATALLDESKNDISSFLGNSPSFTDNDLKELNSLKGIKKIEEGYRNISAGKNAIKANSEKISFNEIQTTSALLTSAQLVSGKFPKKNSVMLSETLANELPDDYVGNKITIQLTIGSKQVDQEVTVSGIYKSNGNPLTSIFIPYDTLKKIYRGQNSEIETNVVYITANSSSKIEELRNQLIKLGYSSSLQDTLIKMFMQLLRMLTFVLTGVAAVSLIVASIMMLVVLNISIVERTNEIGVLKALGARKRDIRRVFISEAISLGMLSGIQGVIISLITFFIVNHYTNSLFDTNVLIIKLEDVFLAFSICIVLSIISSLLPASKAARLDPVKALR